MSFRSLLALPLFLAACQPTPVATPEGAESPSAEQPAADPAEHTPTKVTPSPETEELADPDTVVATWDDGSLTYGEVVEKVHGRLVKMEIDYLRERYQLLSKTIDDQIDEVLLEAEAARRGLEDADALLDVEVNDKYDSVSEAQIKEFYEKNKRRLRNRPLEQVRDAVERRALNTIRKEAMEAFIDKLRAQAGVEVDLAPPEYPKLEVPIGDDPMRGNPDAPVTIVEFAEYQCPYCGRGYQTMKKVMEEYEGQVRWIYRDYPLSFHRQAVPAAIAANCAGEQDAYWEMHDLLLENQRDLDDDDLQGYAEDLGLDLARWKACTEEEGRHEEEVRNDMAEGQAFGVSGTPAYFINGVFLSGARPYESFAEVIDQELAKAAD